MKKRFFAIVFAAVSVLCALAALAACGGPDTEIDKSISEIRLNIYEGRSSAFEVEVFIGKREKPYSLDGVSGTLVDYCVVSVTPASEIDKDITLNYTVSGGQYNHSGTLEKDAATGKYRADAGVYHAGVSEINVTVSGGDITDSIIANAKHTTDMITWKEALGVAREALSECFEAAFLGGQFKGEIFVRFVNVPVMGEDKFYWYVLLKDQKGKLSSVLIDSINREVVAKNVL